MLDWFLRWPSYHSIALLMSTIEVNTVRLHIVFENKNCAKNELSWERQKNVKKENKNDTKNALKQVPILRYKLPKEKMAEKVLCKSYKPEERFFFC